MSLVTLVESGQAVESDEASISGEAAGCVQPLNSPGSKGTARAEREDRELRDLACLRQPQREGTSPSLREVRGVGWARSSNEAG